MSEALITLMSDALPRAGRVAAIGFDPSAVQELRGVLAPAEIVAAEDIDELTSTYDALAAGPAWEEACSQEMQQTFQERLARLATLVPPGGALAVTVENPHSTARLLSGQPESLSNHDLNAAAFDADRPVAPRALSRAFRAAGFAAANVHSIFGSETRWCILDDDALQVAARVDALTRLVTTSVASESDSLLLADLFFESLTASGALHTAASSFVVLVGGSGRSVYVGDSNGVQWLDGSSADTQWAVGGSSEDPDRATSIPLGSSAHRLLLAAAAAGNTGQFREIANRLGRWVATSSSLDARTDLGWRDVIAADDAFTVMVGVPGAGSEVNPEPRDVLLARAWRHFIDDVRTAQLELPWPTTLSDDELMHLWLSMSGLDEDRSHALVRLVGASPDNKRAADYVRLAEGATLRIKALEAEVAALHATLHSRDDELAVRGRAIRSLRAQVLTATNDREQMEKANTDIKNSAAFKLASQFRKAALVTRPKLLIREVGKAADKRVRSLRRAG